jgi:hypothetical protein
MMPPLPPAPPRPRTVYLREREEYHKRQVCLHEFGRIKQFKTDVGSGFLPGRDGQ